MNVDLQRFIQFVQGDQHAAQIDQRFVRRRVLLQGLTETLLGQRETARLIGDGAQRVPGGGELRRQFHGVLQMFFGGVHVALLQIALRVGEIADGAVGDGEFARGNGVPAAVAGGIEIVVLQDDGEPDAVARVRPARPHFDGLARFAAAGLEHGYGVTGRRQSLEMEAAVLVGESRRGKRMRGAE